MLKTTNNYDAIGKTRVFEQCFPYESGEMSINDKLRSGRGVWLSEFYQKIW